MMNVDNDGLCCCSLVIVYNSNDPMLLILDNSDSPSIVIIRTWFVYNTFIDGSLLALDLSYALCLVPSFLQHG